MRSMPGGRTFVRLASDLIGFDTTAREPDDPPRQEHAFQSYLAGRLATAGAETELIELERSELEGKPLYVPGMGFEGRPQLVARFPGADGRCS